MSKWYGESERKLARIFDVAAKPGPCILFLDEIDSLATARNEQMHEATRRLLSVLLRKIDGVITSGTSPVIGATNRPGDLDSAPRSRFAETIEFPMPTTADRHEILRLNAMHLNDVDLLEIASATEGWSGRDLRHLCDRVERTWIASLIGENREPSSPPTASYLAVATSRPSDDSDHR